MDNAISYLINHSPVDSMVCFGNTYPLDSDLSGGWCYLSLHLGLIDCTSIIFRTSVI